MAEEIVLWRVRHKATGRYLWKGTRTTWNKSGDAANAWNTSPERWYKTGGTWVKGKVFSEQDEWETVKFHLVEAN